MQSAMVAVAVAPHAMLCLGLLQITPDPLICKSKAEGPQISVLGKGE